MGADDRSNSKGAGARTRAKSKGWTRPRNHAVGTVQFWKENGDTTSYKWLNDTEWEKIDTVTDDESESETVANAKVSIQSLTKMKKALQKEGKSDTSRRMIASIDAELNSTR